MNILTKQLAQDCYAAVLDWQSNLPLDCNSGDLTIAPTFHAICTQTQNTAQLPSEAQDSCCAPATL